MCATGQLLKTVTIFSPDIIAAEIVEDLQAALAQFAGIASDLKRRDIASGS